VLIPLLGDRDENVRVSAAWAVGKIGFPHALAALVPLLSDPSAAVADAASGALACLHWDSLLNPDEVPRMAGPVLLTASGWPATAPASAMLVLTENRKPDETDRPGPGRRRLILIDGRDLRVREAELDPEAIAPVPGGALHLVRHGKRVAVRPLLRTQPEWLSTILAAG
jgi:HEAT repeat protein